MKKYVLALAVAISLIGLVALFFLRPSVSPQVLELKGTVKTVRDSGKVTFITFVPDDFSVLSFDPVNLDEGKHTLRGHLQEYKGKVEFVVESYD